MGYPVLRRICLAGMVALFAIGISCEKPTDNDPECTSIKVISPTGGETFHVGQAFTIQWCLPAGWSASQTRVKLSTNNGFTYTDIGNPINVPKTDTTFTPTQAMVSDSCIIQVSDYGETIGMFAWSDSTFKIVP
jgi:hypothetical protein